jgi:glutaconate CoA-transferase subunit B
MTSNSYHIDEFMAIILSRDLMDGELGEMGAYSEIPMAACKLARLLHAPNLNWWCSATSYLNPTGPLHHSSTDHRNIMGAEAVLHMNEALFYAVPHYDFFFLGGMQVDRFGNVNLTVIGDWKKPKLRGPGCAALPGVTALPIRSYIYMNRHDTRSFVEELDFVSGVGYLSGGDSRREIGLPEGGGPCLVVSPLAVMDFEDKTKRMRVKSLHPGISMEEVTQNTGFELVLPETISETPCPKEEEIRVLRKEVDPYGVLRGKS